MVEKPPRWLCNPVCHFRWYVAILSPGTQDGQVHAAQRLPRSLGHRALAHALSPRRSACPPRVGGESSVRQAVFESVKFIFVSLLKIAAIAPCDRNLPPSTWG